MAKLTRNEYRIWLADLAAVWHKARQNAAKLTGAPAAEARALEKVAAAAFADAKRAAEKAFLQVLHNTTTGTVRVFQPGQAGAPRGER